MKARQERFAAGGKAKNDPVNTTSSGRLPCTVCWLVSALIVLVTFAAFFPVLQNGFVNWDDDENFLRNPNYRGLGWTQLHWMFTTLHMGQYQPLTWINLGQDYLLWGMNPFGYHLTSLFLHIANGVLFYWISLHLLHLTMASRGISGELLLQVAAGFSAITFALHPLRVEAVAWVSDRNDVLASLFSLATILCYLRATTVARTEAPGRRWMTAAVTLYAMSLLSKPIGMTLPLVLLVLDIYPLRRLGGVPGRWFSSAARQVWWEKMPFLLLAIGAGIIALLAKHEAQTSLEQHGIVWRIAQVLFGLTFYLWKTIIPLGLSPLYETVTDAIPVKWPFQPSEVMILTLSVTATLAVSLVLFVLRRRWPAGWACWICYALLLSPVLGIFQAGPQLVADRYSYLPCLGWAVLAGAGMASCWKLEGRGRVSRPIFLFANGLAATVLLSLAILTWQQTQVWHDSERLWRHAHAVVRQSSSVHNKLGYALFTQGKLDEAMNHFHHAIELEPGLAAAHSGLGQVLAERGQLEEAIRCFRRALELEPGNANGYYDLGLALALRGELEPAIDHFRRSAELDPFNAKAHYNLGVALAMRGELEGAIDHFRKTVLIEPQSAEAHESLARALALQGKRDEAAKHYEEALRILKSRPETSVLR